jgi:protein O-GlcNAc transferase
MNINTATQSSFNYYHEGKLDEAGQICEKILAKKPDNLNALHLLGIIYYQSKQYALSIRFLQRAIQNNPNIADTYFNLGASLKKQGQDEEAVASYQKALLLNPTFFEAYNNLGIICYEHGQYGEASIYYQKALQFNPTFFEAFRNLGAVFKAQGLIIEAENAFKHALQIKPDLSSCYSDVLFGMNYQTRYNNQSIFVEHLQFAERYEKPLAYFISAHKNERAYSRPLKIGYISPDFRRHSVAYFIEPIINAHNKDQFEIFCYSDVIVQDDVTKRIQEHADQWRNIVGMTDKYVAGLLRKDQIDILVDLTGHTMNNRMLVFCRKPAPIQISWIGYPATTGLSTIDYKIVDAYTDPIGMTDPFYTENLIRLPQSFLCYQPEQNGPEVNNLPSSKSGHITFGSFNDLAKVSPAVVSLWSEIVNKVSNSSLIIKSKGLSDKDTCNRFLEMFVQHGIDRERIILLPLTLSTEEHLRMYNNIDIALDTFPYNGTTTTCEAMWMGVPVITLAGNAHVSRVGISLLSNVGLKEFIAQTENEYILIAAKLAADINKLQMLRSNLRTMLKNSPLTNTEQFVFDLENSYRKMWESWCISIPQ